MIIMFSLSALILMILGCGWLFYKDYTEHRLPNYGVLLVGICALIYHICGAHLQTSPSWWNLLLGAFIGVLFMVTIRYFANRRYKTETLGMGDIKLILVSGLWVGFPFIFHVVSLKCSCIRCFVFFVVVGGPQGAREGCPNPQKRTHN